MEIISITKDSVSAELQYKIERAIYPEGEVILPMENRGPVPSKEKDITGLSVGTGMVVRNPNPLLFPTWSSKASHARRMRNMLFVMHQHKHLDSIEILRLR